MLSTPGCWARDEIGALSRGVFWGVLVADTGSVREYLVREEDKAELCAATDGGRDLRGDRGLMALVTDRLRHGC